MCCFVERQHGRVIVYIMSMLSIKQRVTGRFGQDPFRPEKTWMFRPKAWTIWPKNMDVSAKYIFNSFTESDIIISRG